MYACAYRHDYYTCLHMSTHAYTYTCIIHEESYANHPVRIVQCVKSIIGINPENPSKKLLSFCTDFGNIDATHLFPPTLYVSANDSILTLSPFSKNLHVLLFILIPSLFSGHTSSGLHTFSSSIVKLIAPGALHLSPIGTHVGVPNTGCPST